MNLLLTSVGRRSYIVEYFKRALAGEGEVHACNSSYTIGMQVADKHFIAPLIYDDNYVPAILHYCKTHAIVAVLSLFDIDLMVLARHRELFREHGIRLILAPPESIELCNDKWRTHEFMTAHNIGSPHTYRSVSEAVTAVSRGEVNYPLLIKPRWGMASMGIYTVDCEEELAVLYRKSCRDIFKTYLKYESSATPEAVMLVQQKLDGLEYGLDVINDLTGHFVTVFAKQKVAMRAGETDVGRSVDSARFEGIARTLSAELKHEGVLSVDCIQSGGRIYVIDLNCRISGHYPVSHALGVDVPRQIVVWLQGGATDHSLLHCQTDGFVTKDLVPVRLHCPL